MGHLLQALDLTANTTFMQKGKIAFSNYYSECIMEELHNNPKRNVTTIDIHLKLLTLKLMHGKLMGLIYERSSQQKEWNNYA